LTCRTRVSHQDVLRLARRPSSASTNFAEDFQRNVKTTSGIPAILRAVKAKRTADPRWPVAATGKHTVEFDFKYEKPGLGQGGTGTW